MNLRRSTFLATALVVGLAACGETTMEVEMEQDPEDERVILATPSFATDINEIVQRLGCSGGGCHGGGAGGLTLTTSAAANYAAIVGIQASGEAFQLINPGDPDNSYIVIKVEGRQAVGQRMPRGGAAIDNIDLTNLRNWVTNGAPNN